MTMITHLYLHILTILKDFYTVLIFILSVQEFQLDSTFTH